MRISVLILLLLTVTSLAEPLDIDYSRMRNLERWKPQIQNYSERHYGERDWRLFPTCIVLHYTATKNFPWNLVRDGSYLGETPGLAAHYIVHGDKVWEILPTDVRSRGAYGINHRAINIEMVAANADDLAGRTETLVTCQKLIKLLMMRHAIEKDRIYSHQQVATMNRQIVPECLDLINGAPYDKIDPGEQNMKTILEGL